MINKRALGGIFIFTIVETLWIGLVLAGVGYDIGAIFTDPVLAFTAFVVLLEEHIIAHNVGQGKGFPQYFLPPSVD